MASQFVAGFPRIGYVRRSGHCTGHHCRCCSDHGDVAAAGTRIALLVTQMRPTGRVLEIACGTGLWPQALAGLADTATAVHAAPEAVEIARE